MFLVEPLVPFGQSQHPFARSLLKLILSSVVEGRWICLLKPLAEIPALGLCDPVRLAAFISLESGNILDIPVRASCTKLVFSLIYLISCLVIARSVSFAR